MQFVFWVAGNDIREDCCWLTVRDGRGSTIFAQPVEAGPSIGAMLIRSNTTMCVCMCEHQKRLWFTHAFREQSLSSLFCFPAIQNTGHSFLWQLISTCVMGKTQTLDFIRNWFQFLKIFRVGLFAFLQLVNFTLPTFSDIQNFLNTAYHLCSGAIAVTV